MTAIGAEPPASLSPNTHTIGIFIYYISDWSLEDTGRNQTLPSRSSKIVEEKDPPGFGSINLNSRVR